MSRILERFKEYVNITQFNAIRVSLASPERIKSLSYGEVKKIETINYRTLKPERDGLFCARIFGPVKDWECNCGKYKRMKHRGVTCEKCGVEVIQARVRRERMGHVELVAPVVHIWYLKGIPSYLGLILDVPVKDLERVIYFDASIVIHQGKSPYPRKTLLNAQELEQYEIAHPDDFAFVAKTGAEAIQEILALIDIKLEIVSLEEDYRKTTSVAMRHKIMRRIRVFSDLLQAHIKPEWMVLSVLPVLPPDLRPLVPLEGGRFASSDLNELYRRVLNRNIRLQRLIEIDAPLVIIRNEKRMLQESVDALIDNGRRGQPVRGSNRRPLKSLSEMLRGKQGRFRQNLLGRRVDYSGRSVIVVDPELQMDQCGIPKIMALELFKSYIYGELLKREIAANLRIAKKMVEDLEPVVWDVLEDVVRGRPILLNRAPTLHRLGIQAFYPTLVEGKAIKVHPLVCAAFNADFDGDQMAVHLPLSKKAQLECESLMLSSKNILSPASGRPVTAPSQEMVLGLYYMTKARSGVVGEGAIFASKAEVVAAYQAGQVHLHAQIQVRLDGQPLVATTVGRIVLYDALPADIPFYLINKVLKKSALTKLVEKIYYQFGREITVKALDSIKGLGFRYATRGGISLSLHDLIVPEKKYSIVAAAEKEVEKVEQLYIDGIITNGERENKVLSIWGRATTDVGKAVSEVLELQDEVAFKNEDKKAQPFNPVFMMLDSGSRGSKEQIRQLVGMRGPMARPSGEIIETPVKTNFKVGLSVFEYFISTHGARKGQSDTALKTANSGYLTRRLVDVAQDVIVSTQDCQTLGYTTVRDMKESDEIVLPLGQRIFGRVLAADVKDPISGQLVLTQGTVVGRDEVALLADTAVSEVMVRSVLTCNAKRGVCVQCYGYDLSRGALADVGATVGTIAAQSIGEPGTQLTMRTFHIGGTASGFATHSYVAAKQAGIVELRAINLVENRDGKVVNISRKAKILLMSADGRELQRNDLEYGSTLLVKDGQEVTIGTKLAEWDPNNKIILTEYAGTVSFIDLIENVTLQERYDEATHKSTIMVLENRGEKYQPALSIVGADGSEISHYYLPAGSLLTVEAGQTVRAGDIIVKIPREIQKTKDITGGLSRIAELFEARLPKDPAIIADIDGQVVFGGLHRGLRKISVVNGVDTYDYFVPRGKQVNVMDGDHVTAGDQLTTGAPVLHDMLRILGPNVVQSYLVDQIQEIYRLQGVDISDKHIEVIVRQMMRKVRVIDAGDTDLLIGDRVDSMHFMSVNAALRAEGKKPAVGRPVLMGLTQASLSTESWISAASFQETTRILTEAALSGQEDFLYGLKENVTVGKLIPAGTGILSFRKKYLGTHKTELERQAQESEKRGIGA